MMTLLVFAECEGQFAEWKRWQWAPVDCVFAADECTIMRQSGKKLEVVMLPNWIKNPDYATIRNLKQLISRIRKV